MRRRVGISWGIAIGLSVAAISHVAYWYLPRERPGQPSATAGELLGSPAWDRVLWIPYPHQNLAQLERRTGEVRRWLELVRNDADGGSSTVPSFGPFALPPAREIVLSERDDGRGLRVLIDVLPAARLMARAAGAVARNPWLAGGPVRLSGGRRGKVSWQKGSWILESTGQRSATDRFAAPVLPEGPALAVLALRGGLDRLPPAVYRLIRSESGLELRAGLGNEPLQRPLMEPPAPMAWMFEKGAGEGTIAGVALWAEPSILPPFPVVSTLSLGGRAQRLPGEELLRIAGRSPFRDQAGGWDIRTYEASESAAAKRLVASLDAANADWDRLELLAGAEVDELRRAAAGLATQFHGLPVARLAGFDPGRIASLLGVMEGCGRSRIAIRSRPRSVRWIVCPGREPADAN